MTTFTSPSVQLVNSSGDDLTVVNAARVSFAKEHSKLEDKDVNLINYLANNDHWTCFGHCFASFRIKAPIFVARQLVKHSVGLCWNEESRRYIDHEPEFYLPGGLRTRPENIKQGSLPVPPEDESEALGEMKQITKNSHESYLRLLRASVCPEQARMVLPLNTMTEWLWSGSLAAWARVCNLRLDDHTQMETRQVAELISGEMGILYPKSWQALVLK